MSESGIYNKTGAELKIRSQEISKDGYLMRDEFLSKAVRYTLYSSL